MQVKQGVFEIEPVQQVLSLAVRVPRIDWTLADDMKCLGIYYPNYPSPRLGMVNYGGIRKTIQRKTI